MIFMYERERKENILIDYLEELFEEPQAGALIRGSNEYSGTKIACGEITR